MINVYFNYYFPKTLIRQNEVLTCFEKWINNKHIENVYPLHGRPSFKNYMEKADKVSGPDDINIICNSDCYLDEEDTLLMNEIENGEAWALSRTNIVTLDPFVTEPGFTSYACHDAWIFRGKPRGLTEMNIDFLPGVPACDYRFTYELNRFYPRLRNPCVSIRLYHLHLPLGSRDWDIKDRIKYENNMLIVLPSSLTYEERDMVLI